MRLNKKNSSKSQMQCGKYSVGEPYWLISPKFAWQLSCWSYWPNVAVQGF